MSETEICEAVILPFARVERRQPAEYDGGHVPASQMTIYVVFTRDAQPLTFREGRHLADALAHLTQDLR